jgi:protein-S-isoprenylcysteine O-methyltransferase Ste14
MIPYVVLILLWVAWCFLHSFTISFTVTGFVRKYFESAYRYYRIFYNLTALATLVPVLGYTFSMRGLPVFRWEGPFRIIQGLLVLSALVLFVGGARRYDLPRFIGIRQVREDNACSVLTEDCRLDTGGMLGIVRHPWYSGGILIVWTGNLDVTAILTNLVITGYFLIGAFIEERKLLAEFGEEYLDYRRRVSMFFPFRWSIQKLKGIKGRSSSKEK